MNDDVLKTPLTEGEPLAGMPQSSTTHAPTAEEMLEVLWGVYEDHYSDTSLIASLKDPILDIYTDAPNQDIVDIGCGQSPLILKYLGTSNRLMGIDKYEYQVTALRKRIHRMGDPQGKAKVLRGDFPWMSIDDTGFGIGVLMNVLHFMDTEHQLATIKALEGLLTDGAFVFVQSFSDQHPAAETTDRKVFKSFFSKDDIMALFPSDRFRCVKPPVLFTENSDEEDIEYIRKWYDAMGRKWNWSQDWTRARCADYLAEPDAIYVQGLFQLRKSQ